MTKLANHEKPFLDRFVTVLVEYVIKDGAAHRMLRSGDVRLLIDPDKLATILGQRALRSKRRMATALDGAIVVQVVGKVEEWGDEQPLPAPAPR